MCPKRGIAPQLWSKFNLPCTRLPAALLCSTRITGSFLEPISGHGISPDELFQWEALVLYFARWTNSICMKLIDKLPVCSMCGLSGLLGLNMHGICTVISKALGRSSAADVWKFDICCAVTSQHSGLVFTAQSDRTCGRDEVIQVQSCKLQILL